MSDEITSPSSSYALVADTPEGDPPEGHSLVADTPEGDTPEGHHVLDQTPRWRRHPHPIRPVVPSTNVNDHQLEMVSSPSDHKPISTELIDT
ncbi:hypothetical protein CCACVL1_10077 [Corchorus capsularis]|uniref:Uncharacterized protein n=1 Tax=Corchorus capsularis TaxID=210143 RepID=A0A1R3ISY1_COCAP|nr:hypothetical protein CCACVL1_10077 [Corchorus capsularis]